MPVAIAIALKLFDLLAIGGDEQVFRQGWNRAIVGKFFGAVEAGGAGREHFDNQARVLNELLVARAIAIVAGNDEVRVVEGIASVDAGFHAFGKNAAARPEEMGSEQERELADDRVVVERTAGHGEHLAVAVFVADGADFFGSEVVFDGDVERIVGEHGRAQAAIVSLTIAQWHQLPQAVAPNPPCPPQKRDRDRTRP